MSVRISQSVRYVADFSCNVRPPAVVWNGCGRPLSYEAQDAPSVPRCSRKAAQFTRPSRTHRSAGRPTVLIITRKPREKIMPGDDVVVHVMEIVGNSVRGGIQAPRSLPVYREEIWRAVRQENQAAGLDALP